MDGDADGDCRTFVVVVCLRGRPFWCVALPCDERCEVLVSQPESVDRGKFHL